MFSDDPRNTTGKPYFFYTTLMRSPPPVEITDERTGRSLAAMLEPDLMLEREVMRADRFPGLVATFRNMYGTRFQETHTASETQELLEGIANETLNGSIGNKSWELGVQHGCCSGAQECLMRYFFAEVYEKEGGRGGFYYISAKRTERLGFNLCRSPVGTGINSTRNKPQSRYGDTYDGWGSCADWIVLNDSAPTEKAPVEPTPPPRVPPTK
jgi:hypothetical protein